ISSNSIAAPSSRDTIWSRYSRYLEWSRPSLAPPGKNALRPSIRPLVSCLMADIRAASPPSPPFHRFPSLRTASGSMLGMCRLHIGRSAGRCDSASGGGVAGGQNGERILFEILGARVPDRAGVAGDGGDVALHGGGEVPVRPGALPWATVDDRGELSRLAHRGLGVRDGVGEPSQPCSRSRVRSGGSRDLVGVSWGGTTANGLPASRAARLAVTSAPTACCLAA